MRARGSAHAADSVTAELSALIWEDSCVEPAFEIIFSITVFKPLFQYAAERAERTGLFFLFFLLELSV